MSEKILKALMRLFAIIAKADDNPNNATAIVESYLKQFLNKEQVAEYLAIYLNYLNQQDENTEGEKKKRRLAVSSVKVIVICEQINEELTQKQKFVVLLNLIEFASFNGTISEQEMEFISTVYSSFNIPDEEFIQCLQLSGSNENVVFEDSSNFLKIAAHKSTSYQQLKQLTAASLKGDLVVLRIESVGIYLLRYFGKDELFLNSQIISPTKIYILSPGASIRSSKINSIYYSDIVGCFLADTADTKITFEVESLEYKFKNGKIGLHPLSFSEKGGKLIGIMGGSGAGKSTLLNILNGNNKPSNGSVIINGINLHKEKKKLEGVIGFIPQDDLLIEELTVYQNLFYNAKLCFADKNDATINELVLKVLNDLGLIEAKDLKVGNPLAQTISGGQRKRLNIALELIREPAVLFVDEPTSGLSSRDSENCMDLLKELALKGKLIFVVIHQPSSDIFKLFDKLLLLDTGGYPIYNGNPVEAIVYFKTLINQVNANSSDCILCGNVNPEQIFNIIEAKVVDENGNQTRNRRISPKDWNEFYISNNAPTNTYLNEAIKKEIANTFRKPNFFNQFKVFATRNVLSKLADAQFLAINFLEAPLLAFLLATLTKYYKNNGEYVFSENKNIPAYLFMAVLVALFIGLTVSAEEIIRDRKILKREAFLNLSKGSYLLSKIIVLFFISAIQTFTFVIIGNYILQIENMFTNYWLILFSTSCFANMLGLNISSAFNSAVTIYIVVPILLIPQILLSGVIVKFEELNPRISSQSVVPVWGEVMASRWAFEALAVTQFKVNAYEKNFFKLDKTISNSSFKKIYWHSKMMELLDKKNRTNEETQIVLNEIKNEIQFNPTVPFSQATLLPEELTTSSISNIKEYLNNLKKYYTEKYAASIKEKDELVLKLQEKNSAEFQNLLTSNQNKKIEDLVKNQTSDLDPCLVENHQLVATSDPVFNDGSSEHFLRSHFYAATKNFFGKQVSTFWINLLVIWSMTLLLWITLYFDMFRKLLRYLSLFSNKLKLKKTA